MNLKTIPFTLAALFGLVGSSSAYQGGELSAGVSLPDVSPWTLSCRSEIFGYEVRRAVAGEFTGDGTPDVWQQAETSVVLFMNPSYMDYQFENQIATVSVACLPRTDHLTRDRLLYSTSNGLYAAEFTCNESSPFVTTAIEEGDWAGAKSLSVSDLDLDGNLDILGINAAGDYLLRLLGDGYGNYYAADPIWIGSNGREAFSLIYEVGEPPQYAVLTSSLMYIIEEDRTVSYLSLASSFGHIAKVTQKPDGATEFADCVVWLRDVPGGGGNKQISVVDNESSTPLVVLLDTIDASAICTGDVDGNGADDINFVTKNTREAYTLYNQRSSAQTTGDRFTEHSAQGISLCSASSTGADNTTTPVLVDLNSNHTADLFTIDAEIKVALAIPWELTPLPGVAQGWISTQAHPCFYRGDFFPDQVLGSCGQYTNEGIFMLSLKNPWNILSTESGWKMELVLYRQEASGGVDPAAVQHYLYDLDGGATNDYRTAKRGTSDWAFPIRFNTTAATFTHKYYAVVRPIPPSSYTGQELPVFVVGLTSEGSTNWSSGGPVEYLIGLADAWDGTLEQHLYTIGDVCSDLDTAVTRSDTCGGNVPLMRVPRYIQGQTPNPGTPVTPPQVIGTGGG